MAAPTTLPPLLQHAPIPIAALDLQGAVTAVNRALLDASGYAETDLRGMPFSAFLDAAEDAAARASYDMLASGAADSYRAERCYRTKSGDLRDIELTVSLVRDASGAPELCLAVLQDVTDHKRTLAEAARRAAELEAIIESMPAAVYIGNENGITLANSAAVEQLGFANADALKHPIPDLSMLLENRDAATGEPIPPEQEPFARAIRGERVDAEVISKHLMSGEEVVQRVITAPVRVDGRIVAAVAINTDISDRRRTEEALRMSEARYRALIEQAPLSIQILSPDGRTLQVNSAWERLWGATLEQLGNYNMLEDQQLADRGLLPFIRRAFDGEPALVPASEYDPSQTLPNVSDHEDPRRWVRAVIYPIKDKRGHVREIVLIHEDITDQVRADEQRREATELLHLVIQQSGEAIIVADPAGVMRIFNPAAERLHGVAGGPTPIEDWTRHYRLLRLDGTPLPAEETALFRALHGEDVRDARWLVQLENGSARRLVGTAAPLRRPDGSPAGAVLIARDETERLAAEAERERLLVEAQRAHREVERASRMKDEFLATLSHELRTPLNAVLGWARILRTRDIDTNVAHAIDVIERNAAAQARLIDDLLDVSRIITGKIGLQLEPVDLAGTVVSAIETVRPAADGRGVTIESTVQSDLPPFVGDTQRLQQVLWNLLSNAVKFTASGGRVRISVTAEPGAIVIVVQDTGIGISAPMLPYIFERFTQEDSSSTRTHSGLGLGLAIVRHVVELHGGTVSAESPGAGGGSTFRVYLPHAPRVRT